MDSVDFHIAAAVTLREKGQGEKQPADQCGEQEMRPDHIEPRATIKNAQIFDIAISNG
jgi:hypothetical protein